MKKKVDVLEYLDARHYDLKVKSLMRDRLDDIPFYLNKAREYGDPVLEIACGTGRVTIPIAKEGVSITGLDLLNSMLREAGKKAKEENLNIEWIEGDMTNFNLNRRFNLIIIPAVAFNWILENDNIRKCLECVKKHLTSKGRFILTAFNPDLEILARDPAKTFPNAEYPDPDGKGLITVRESNFYDKKSQINSVKYHYFIGGKELINELKLRMIFPKELDMILKYNGFIIEAKFGEFDETPFTSDSRLQIIVCHVKE
jgi:ubiquinone/menaquinone biosynthesis C-methylase UbiE